VRRTIRALLRPTEFFDDCQRRYGDFFTLHTPLERTIVFTSDPETVRQVFRGDPAAVGRGSTLKHFVTSPVAITSLRSLSVLWLELVKAELQVEFTVRNRAEITHSQTHRHGS
jgi:cytochrome P450